MNLEIGVEIRPDPGVGRAVVYVNGWPAATVTCLGPKWFSVCLLDEEGHEIGAEPKWLPHEALEAAKTIAFDVVKYSRTESK